MMAISQSLTGDIPNDHPTPHQRRHDAKGLAVKTRKIVATADAVAGQPRFDGTRLTVSWWLGYRLAGRSDADIIAEWPQLSQKDLDAARKWLDKLIDKQRQKS